MFDIIKSDRPRYAPIDIPTSLKYAEWDFENTAQITTPGGAISAFVDPVTGASFAQGTGSAQPAHSRTVFNTGAAGVFDGGDSLRNTTAVATLGWPTGGAFEIWAAVEYTGTLDAPQHDIFTYPVNTVNTSLSLSFVQTAGVMRARFRVGTGAANVDIIDTSADVLTGRHILRAVSDGSTIRLDVDGRVGAPVACVAGGFTGGPRHTIGANGAVSSTTFWIGNIAYVGFFNPLNDFYASSLYRNLRLRRDSTP